MLTEAEGRGTSTFTSGAVRLSPSFPAEAPTTALVFAAPPSVTEGSLELMAQPIFIARMGNNVIKIYNFFIFKIIIRLDQKNTRKKLNFFY